jgi:hypothetical protein
MNFTLDKVITITFMFVGKKKFRKQNVAKGRSQDMIHFGKGYRVFSEEVAQRFQ